MGSFVENVNKVAALIPAESVDLGVVVDNIDNINLLTPVITDLKSIVDNVVPNIAEILLADDNASTATTQAGEASASASQALGYRNEALGFRNEAEAFNESKAFVVDTVEDLLIIPSSYFTAIVRDLNRGGTFIWSSTGTANGGTVFAGATGFWTRQYSGAVSVKWFGAVGDGVTYDKVAIQSAIDYGYEITGDNLTYNLANNFITISKPTILKDIKLKVNAEKTALIISSSNVIVDNVEINGTSNSTYHTSGRGIDVIGIDNGAGIAPTYISNVTIKNCKIFNFSFIGIKPSYVDNLVVDTCEIYNIKYAGFGASSCKNSIVKNCNIHDITDGNGLNAYGGYWSQGNSSDAVRYPVCDNCTFDRNKVYGVFWEGLDTHGGSQIKFTNNYISNCGDGIAIVVADDEVSATLSSTIRAMVDGNTIVDCVSAVSSWGYESTVDQSYHTGVTIINNNIKNCGNGSSTTGGAIRLRKTNSCIVSNNTLSMSNSNGIISIYDNLYASFEGNTFLHIKSPIYATQAINIYGENFSGIIGGNTLSKYQSGIPNDSGSGLRIGTALINVTVNTYQNNFKVATYPYNISDAQAAKMTNPSSISNTGSISVVSTNSTAITTIDVTGFFTGGTIYDLAVTLKTTTIKKLRLKARVVSATSIEITAETVDGTTFGVTESVAFYYIASGF